ncbi:MAG: PBP1A family penicillin-binding protein [Proteobacteria bacterium]|nr:PBP1A family penicillin-binding protein [Pseudomonadota bacterium]
MTTRKKKLSVRLAVTLAVAGVLTGLAVGLLLAVGQDLPQIQGLEDFHPSAVTRILSADGRLMAELFIQKRLPLPLDRIPLPLRQAMIAVEDRRFYEHPGLDVIRNAAALLKDIQAGRLAEGASTITQQLARDLFLTPDKTFSRKLKEIFLAIQIEGRYTKDEILRLYLNQIYLGAGTYGVGAAAETYFGKKPEELTLGECALLAGLPRSPERYQPLEHPRRALARRRIVLRAMLREGLISPEDARTAREEPLRLAAPARTRTLAPYFVEHIRRQLLDLFGENAVYKGGLVVETTLDLEAQAKAEQALLAGLDSMGNDPAGDKAAPAEGRAHPDDIEGAIVAIEVGSGRILSWAGGRDFSRSPFDRVDQALRQPGSAFKPVIYAAAVESGLTQADRIYDGPLVYRLPGQDALWRPQNYSRRFEGETTLRRALEVSGNIPAIKLLSRVGLEPVLALAVRLGLTSPLQRNLALALGASEVRLLELVSAYAALAGGGLWVEPYGLVRVRDRQGREIYRAAPGHRKAVSQETAYIMTDMLTGVVTDGTAQRAKGLGRSLAGKTGTTDDFRDAWFIGYGPELAAGVWVGADSGRPLGPGWTGARAALPIWTEFMGRVLENRPARPFQPPAGIVWAGMNRFTGTPARPGEPGYVRAAFKAGTEPK